MRIVAAWYQDPHHPLLLRYWDGEGWTNHVQPAPDGELIAGVELAETVGNGATALVYRGHQAALGRDVAVKIINGTFDAAARQRFEREQVAMGRLSVHPGIVPVYQSGMTTTGQPYLVMPFLPNSLADELLRVGRFDPPSACRVMVKVCDALQFAHDQGIVHRDIKPGNILRSPVGEPMIADFGIAQLGVDDTFARQDTSLTPLYAAPEVLNLEGGAPVSDVYSLGATLFTLLQGRPAFSNGERTLAAVHRRVVSEPLPRPSVDLADTVWRALRSAMAKEPELRPHSAALFGQLLREAAGELSSVDAVVPNRQRSGDIDPDSDGHVPAHAARPRRRSARDLWPGSRPR